MKRVLLTSSGHLEAGDRLEVHHLQHLLGLSVNLDDILERNTLESEGSHTNHRLGPRGYQV